MHCSLCFKKTVRRSTVTGLIALSLSASLAFAGECNPEDKAKVIPILGKAVRVIDFTKSSQACLEDFASKVSQRDLLLVAHSNSQAWRDVTIAAATKLQEEGKKVGVAYTNDEDGLNNTAETVAWANGVKRDFAPVTIGGGHTIDEIAAAPDKVIGFIHEVGTEVWNQYLNLPDR